MLATFTLHHVNGAIREYHIYKGIWPNPFAFGTCAYHESLIDKCPVKKGLTKGIREI